MTEEHAPTPDGDSGWEWAVVEVFGHRRHVGRIREVETFGTKMLRIDVPVYPDRAAVAPERWETRLYGGGSIFSISYTDEASVRRANLPYEAPARISYHEAEDDDEAEAADRMEA